MSSKGSRSDVGARGAGTARSLGVEARAKVAPTASLADCAAQYRPLPSSDRNAGHGLPYDQPERLAAVVRAFLQSVATEG